MRTQVFGCKNRRRYNRERALQSSFIFFHFHQLLGFDFHRLPLSGRSFCGGRECALRPPEDPRVQLYDMPPVTAEEDPLPPRLENQGFRRNYFAFFGNPGTPDPSKFEISLTFCEAFSIP